MLLDALLVVPRLEPVIANQPSPTDPVVEELCRYDAHMRRQPRAFADLDRAGERSPPNRVR